MKKIILSVVFVFASFAMVNANTDTKNKGEESILRVNCFQAAWDYGTSHGGGDPYWEWYYTNQYYNNNCG